MGKKTGTNAFGEGVYDNRDGGVHAIDVDGTNRDIIPTGGTTTGKQLALDSAGNLYWGNCEGFALTTAKTDGTGLRDLVRYDGTGQERDWIVGVALDEEHPADLLVAEGLCRRWRRQDPARRPRDPGG